MTMRDPASTDTPAARASRRAPTPGELALDDAMAYRHEKGDSVRSLAAASGVPFTTCRQRLVDQAVRLRSRGGSRGRRRTRPRPGRPLRIGYSMWGFLGSGIIDTPDGTLAYVSTPKSRGRSTGFRRSVRVYAPRSHGTWE